MERRVTTKVSCTVWSRGKGGEYIKTLPIAINQADTDYGVCLQSFIISLNRIESYLSILNEYSDKVAMLIFLNVSYLEGTLRITPNKTTQSGPIKPDCVVALLR